MRRDFQVQTGRLEETKDTQGTDKCSIKMQGLLDTFTEGTRKIISPQLPSHARFETFDACYTYTRIYSIFYISYLKQKKVS